MPVAHHTFLSALAAIPHRLITGGMSETVSALGVTLVAPAIAAARAAPGFLAGTTCSTSGGVATPCTCGVTGSLTMMGPGLTAHGDSLAAFEERCIPAPPGVGGVAPPSNTPGIAIPRRKP